MEAGDWRDPVDESERRSYVSQASREASGMTDLTPELLAKEVAWIKEHLEPPVQENYLSAKRTGRGERLDKRGRQSVLKVFNQYQDLLHYAGKRDWEDVPLRALELIDPGRIVAPRYHAILVDETQDFVPSWFRVILRMMKPETNLLFFVGDGAQRVYRQDLCWSQLGIPLRGRSRILGRVYRNTVEIARYEATCIRKVGAVAEDLAAYGEEWIEADLDHPWARHGSEPILRGFDTVEGEREFLVAETRTLLNQGHSPMDILVLQARRDSAAHTAKALRGGGIPAAIVKESGLTFEPPSVNVCTYHSAKGLEFPVVFCSMTHVFPESRRGDRQEDPQQMEAEAARLLYVGMTRAKDLLYVTYQTR
jgi:superfamily I DNA/RNA helicase